MTSFEAMVSAVLFLNSLGVFGLLFKSGFMIGQNNQRWDDLYKRLNDIKRSQDDFMRSEVAKQKFAEIDRHIDWLRDNPRQNDKAFKAQTGT